MNLDPRVAFYLEHKDQIDEWCRLRSELSPAAHRFFASCADPVRAAAQGLDGKPLTHVEIDCEYPKILYYLPHWRGPGTVPARVAVGIEWVRHSVTFETAYSGIWVDCRHPEGSVVSARLEALVCDVDAAAGYVRRNQWFPAQRIEQPAKPDYWRNLDGFRDDIVTSLARTWRVFAPLISRVVT
jgi:hypothetical protein